MSEVMSLAEDDVAMTTTGQSESSFRLLRQLSIVAAIRGSSSFPSLSFPRAWMLYNNRTQGEQKTAKQKKQNIWYWPNENLTTRTTITSPYNDMLCSFA